VKRGLAVVLVLVVAGCASGGGQRAASPTTTSTTTTSTSTSTTTTARPTTTKPTNQVGKVKPYNVDDGVDKSRVTIGVLAYSDNALLRTYRDPDYPAPGHKYVAVQIRLCAVAKNYPEPITVNWEPWSLNSNDGEAYPPADSYSPETLVGPLYPDGKETPIGTCRKGWLPFEVPNKWKPHYVEYNPGYNKILTWRL
jgi:hypothetical protein